MIQEPITGPADLSLLHELDPAFYPGLLESAASHPVTGRYDLLFAAPGERVEWRGNLRTGDGPRAAPGEDFFSVLRRWAETESVLQSGTLPFAGGWLLYLGYEAARSAEPRLRLPESPLAPPDALALRCRGAIVRDRIAGRDWLVAENQDIAARLRADCVRLRDHRSTVSAAPVVQIREAEPQQFLDGVAAILDYLRAGDCYQANLSRRWDASLREPPLALYRRLREQNPAPFAGFFRDRDWSLLSSSPERLIGVTEDRADTRPIAGTRRRAADAVDDAHLRRELVGDLKERAEHLMLLDLERNDLGRVCRPGSIRVDECMTLETYAHLHHIVSSVRGVLLPGTCAADALRAVFPGGTITGCPKLRAMQIIAELEGEGRGPYTGALGYLSRCGRMDSNILIRTIVCDDNGVSFRTGAGIVADSQPQRELEETRVKARGLLRALGQ